MKSPKSTSKNLSNTELKPRIGEIRRTADGLRRRLFNGRSWRLLCSADPTCPVQSNFACRFHTHLSNYQQQPAPDNQTNSKDEPLNVSMPDGDNFSDKKIKRRSVSRLPADEGDIHTNSNGMRYIRRQSRWQRLCRMDNCTVRADYYCKNHVPQKKSLSSTVQMVSPNISTPSSKDNQPENEQEQLSSGTSPSTQSVLVTNKKSVLSVIGKRRRMNDEATNTVEISPIKKHEMHTRNGRRVRCNGLIWKYLCVDNKKPTHSRKGFRQRQSLPPVEQANQSTQLEDTNIHPTPVLASDTNDVLQTNLVSTLNDNKKRKAKNLNHVQEESTKRTKPGSQVRKVVNKPIVRTSLVTRRRKKLSDEAAFLLDGVYSDGNCMEQTVQSDLNDSFSYQPSKKIGSHYSIEIPVQPPLPPPPTFDPSTLLSINTEPIVTTIKKEMIDEEPFVYAAPVSPNESETICNTLQDFLRVEELKKTSFDLDCQRISYRLAKIEDCIGDVMSFDSTIDKPTTS